LSTLLRDLEGRTEALAARTAEKGAVKRKKPPKRQS